MSGGFDLELAIGDTVFEAGRSLPMLLVDKDPARDLATVAYIPAKAVDPVEKLYRLSRLVFGSRQLR